GRAPDPPKDVGRPRRCECHGAWAVFADSGRPRPGYSRFPDRLAVARNRSPPKRRLWFPGGLSLTKAQRTAPFRRQFGALAAHAPMERKLDPPPSEFLDWHESV